MYRMALVALLVSSLFGLALPAAATPPREPDNKDIPDDWDPYSPDGQPKCWECVPSMEAGLVCRRDHIGYHGCNKGWLFTTGPDGATVTTPTCAVIPYGFCVTLLP